MRLLLGVGSALAVALAFALPAYGHTTDPVQLSFVWPADGTVTSPFGWDGNRPHSGLDIGILRSLTVRASAPGLVEAVGYLDGYEGYGKLVLVDVGAFETLYAHLARARVRTGEYVAAGQRIAVAGCTGWCTG